MRDWAVRRLGGRARYTAIFISLITTSTLEAQTPSASPFVSPDHWSYRVLRRLDHAGQLPRGADVARHAIPQEEIAQLLTSTPYLVRFREEFPDPGQDRFNSSLKLGYRVVKDAVAPGVGYDIDNWTGARPLDDESEAIYAPNVRLFATKILAASLGTQDDGDADVQLVVAGGLIGGWIGKRELGYGAGEGGGLVVESNDLAGGGVYLTRPLKLPLIGPTRFEMHLSKIDNEFNDGTSQAEVEPWFWTARGSFEPIANLRIGINRGMIFGGEGNLPVTFNRVAENIIGIYTDDGESSFANQVISVDFRYRIARGLTAYLDWGADDAAGGWFDVPAILGGLEFVRVDSTYDVAVGIEHLSVARMCCFNSIWYRNAWFRGSWADGDEILGHPLGGNGREWRIFANGGSLNQKLLASGAVFLRRREDENLFAPERAGKSTGVELSADYALSRTLRIGADVIFESGQAGWNSSRGSAAVRYIF